MTPALNVPALETLPPITREAIAAICQATDDPSPLHLDEDYARAAGHRSVIVPGTMLLGWVGQYLERWAGSPTNLRSWEIRFKAPLWPGDQVRLKGRETSADAREVTVTTTDDRLVAVATAVFGPAPMGETR